MNSSHDSESAPLLSHILEECLADHENGLQVGALLDAVAERGFGFLLFLVGLPALVPVLPPGASMVVGGLISIVALQLIWGSSRPWLPRRARNYTFSPKATQALREKGLKMLTKVEKLSRPRLALLTTHLASRLLGPLILVIGLILILPLPFLNTLPALGVMAIGLGLVNRDGLFVIFGTTLCLGIVGFLIYSPGFVLRVVRPYLSR